MYPHVLSPLFPACLLASERLEAPGIHPRKVFYWGYWPFPLKSTEAAGQGVGLDDEYGVT